MYVGVWPELHLAKLVAAATADAESAGGKGSRVSDSPLSRGNSPHGSGRGTPSDRGPASWAGDGRDSLQSLLQVPLCRRVDLDFVNGRAQPRTRPPRPLDIGPNELPTAIRSQSEEHGNGRKKLPPLARHGDAGGSRGASQRPVRSTSSRPSPRAERAHSQPRLYRPPLPEMRTGSTPVANSPAPDEGSGRPVPQLPQGPRPPPPGARMPGAPLPRSPAPPWRAAASPVAAAPAAGSVATAWESPSRALADAVPAPSAALELSATPPWRRHVGDNALPGWLTGMRAQVEHTRATCESEDASPASSDARPLPDQPFPWRNPPKAMSPLPSPSSSPEPTKRPAAGLKSATFKASSHPPRACSPGQRLVPGRHNSSMTTFSPGQVGKSHGETETKERESAVTKPADASSKAVILAALSAPPLSKGSTEPGMAAEAPCHNSPAAPPWATSIESATVQAQMVPAVADREDDALFSPAAEDDDLIAWSQGLCIADLEDMDGGVLDVLAESL
eukprot:gnl/TRDRNA2_/TRDRNA2_130018_c0_seq1.p1 gnl/TRDRNA2_/TRDRNA2_130018_c0~~gnl/TRDRNA2_/TRDRNA2_130018_c0_seq1.p1  ORF type:complete len:505 (-),score=77.30 gnl/TRDRNA2_/TRDRNA2_130018_c0_seq1:83-1597(-)